MKDARDEPRRSRVSILASGRRPLERALVRPRFVSGGCVAGDAMSDDHAYRGGSGTPLVLIHGAMGAWRVWRPVIAQLEEHHDIYAPTLPGHDGCAALPAGVHASVRTLSDAIERRLDDAGIDTAHIAGNSLGGWISLELARRGRARSVVGLCPAGAWGGPTDLAWIVWQLRATSLAVRATRRWADRLGRSRAARLLLSRSVEHPERLADEEIVDILGTAAACTVIEPLVESFRREGQLGPGLDRGACPIRVAWAENDRMLPFERYGRPLLELVPVGEHVVLPGVGHVPMYDDPALVAQTILEVTTRVDQLRA
jgi:pimeloyl-ACP methyl ester carboxylesterase